MLAIKVHTTQLSLVMAEMSPSPHSNSREKKEASSETDTTHTIYELALEIKNNTNNNVAILSFGVSVFALKQSNKLPTT